MHHSSLVPLKKQWFAPLVYFIFIWWYPQQSVDQTTDSSDMRRLTSMPVIWSFKVTSISHTPRINLTLVKVVNIWLFLLRLFAHISLFSASVLKCINSVDWASTYESVIDIPLMNMYGISNGNSKLHRCFRSVHSIHTYESEEGGHLFFSWIHLELLSPWSTQSVDSCIQLHRLPKKNSAHVFAMNTRHN